MTPATTGPMFIPLRKFFLLSIIRMHNDVRSLTYSHHEIVVGIFIDVLYGKS